MRAIATIVRVDTSHFRRPKHTQNSSADLNIGESLANISVAALLFERKSQSRNNLHQGNAPLKEESQMRGQA